MREQRDVLEDHPDPSALGRDRRAGAGHPPAADLDRPGVRRVEPGDESQDGRLAAARRTEDGQHLAGQHVEIDVVDRDDLAERPAQAPNRIGGTGRGTGRARSSRPAPRRAAGPRPSRPTGQQQRRRGRGPGVEPGRGGVPDLGRERLEPDRRQQQGQRQLLDTVRKTSAPPATRAGRRYGTVSHRERPRRTVAERPARLLEARPDRAQRRLAGRRSPGA